MLQRRSRCVQKPYTSWVSLSSSIDGHGLTFQIGANLAICNLHGERIMRARQMIVGAAFQPATVEVMAEALDSAWNVIAPNFRNDPEQIEAARLALAKAI